MRIALLLLVLAVAGCSEVQAPESPEQSPISAMVDELGWDVWIDTGRHQAIAVSHKRRIWCGDSATLMDGETHWQNKNNECWAIRIVPDSVVRAEMDKRGIKQARQGEGE